jgi:hypothetical protein
MFFCKNFKIKRKARYMKLMLKLLLLLLFVGVSSGISLGNEEIPGKIEGVVKDSGSKHVIEYATIRLYDVRDSSMVTGTVSQVDGSFELTGLPKGSYYIVVSFMGFKNIETGMVEIDGSRSSYDFGELFMVANSELLDEIEIVGNRHQIDYQIDKKVISVNQQLASASQTAVEILESVPSIRVDIEGNVSLRGSTGITVLIDGKPTILEASDVLNQLPASTIQNIEIITNPSAKYEPDGSGGIINVITKKSRSLGLQGIMNASTNSFGMLRGDFLLNYNTGKVNYFVSGQYGSHPRIGESINERRTTSNDTTTTLLSKGNYERSGGRNEIKGGLNWTISSSDQLSIEARIGQYQRKNFSNLDYTTFTNVDMTEYHEFSENESERAGDYQSYTLNYSHNFNQKDHDLIFQLNYRKRNGTEYAENFLYDTNDQLNIGSKTTEDGPSGRVDMKLDYTLPISEKHRVEAGFQWRRGLSDEVTNFYLFDEEQDNFVIEEGFWNNTTYDRNIFSAYGIFQSEVANFGYQLGLRSEYTYRNISTASDNNNYLIDRWDFFPTLHLSYDLRADDQLMASYSRRIDRPRGYFLEPFSPGPICTMFEWEIRIFYPNTSMPSSWAI